MTSEYNILVTEPTKDYELLDSGEGEKLERFGDIVLSRPDPQALWPKGQPKATWDKRHGVFARDAKNAKWQMKQGTPTEWPIELGGLTMLVKPTAFKHVGLFPEQVPNWEWIERMIQSVSSSGSTRGSSSEKSWIPAVAGMTKKVRVLNLFGYTGGATLASLKAGAEVVHVDASKTAITWAKNNAELSGLADKPCRWILDDARAFLRREAKRGNKYDGIIMDPPAFGHGPDGELWKIEDHFLDLLALSRAVLSENPLFFLINGYASGYSAVAYENNLNGLMKGFGGDIEIGELTIRETSGRLLPAGIFARWNK